MPASRLASTTFRRAAPVPSRRLRRPKPACSVMRLITPRPSRHCGTAPAQAASTRLTQARPRSLIPASRPAPRCCVCPATMAPSLSATCSVGVRASAWRAERRPCRRVIRISVPICLTTIRCPLPTTRRSPHRTAPNWPIRLSSPARSSSMPVGKCNARPATIRTTIPTASSWSCLIMPPRSARPVIAKITGASAATSCRPRPERRRHQPVAAQQRHDCRRQRLRELSSPTLGRRQ